jgi:hypothetical protein
MAACNNEVWVGPAEGTLQKATFDPPLTMQGVVLEARLAPEGDFAIAYAYLDGIYRVAALGRDPVAGTWHVVGPLTGIGTFMSIQLSNPTRGPDRHFVAVIDNIDLHEYTGDGTTWTDVRTSQQTDLGVGGLYDYPSLTADGLRMVSNGTLSGVQTTLYLYRPDINSPFGAGQPLAVPPVATPFLTEDCGTLYFEALETVLYYQQ